MTQEQVRLQNKRKRKKERRVARAKKLLEKQEKRERRQREKQEALEKARVDGTVETVAATVAISSVLDSSLASILSRRIDLSEDAPDNDNSDDEGGGKPSQAKSQVAAGGGGGGGGGSRVVARGSESEETESDEDDLASSSEEEKTYTNRLVVELEQHRTERALAESSHVALYFSAQWCEPCRAFNAQLAKWSLLHGARLPMQTVFVSFDRDADTFATYFSRMQWLAVPYSDYKRRCMLAEKYQVTSLPALLVVGTDGTVVCRDGRSALLRDPSGFPWAPLLQPHPNPQLKEQAEAEAAALMRGTTHHAARDGEAPPPPATVACGGLFHALGVRKLLQCKPRIEVDTEDELRGRVVCLLFGAAWSSDFQEFWPKLAEALGPKRQPPLAQARLLERKLAVGEIKKLGRHGASLEQRKRAARLQWLLEGEGRGFQVVYCGREQEQQEFNSVVSRLPNTWLALPHPQALLDQADMYVRPHRCPHRCHAV
jgi:nucleoredoxin